MTGRGTFHYQRLNQSPGLKSSFLSQNHPILIGHGCDSTVNERSDIDIGLANSLRKVEFDILKMLIYIYKVLLITKTTLCDSFVHGDDYILIS